jgi:hypothetical protein
MVANKVPITVSPINISIPAKASMCTKKTFMIIPKWIGDHFREILTEKHYKTILFG